MLDTPVSLGALIGHQVLNGYNPSNYELVADSPDALSAIVDDFGRAQRSIDVQFFSFENDIAGASAARVLSHAATRGRAVRLIIDRNFTINQNDNYVYSPRLKPSRRRELRRMVRRNWDMIEDLRSSGAQVHLCNPVWSHWTARDHRKLVLVDREVAWMGGVNPTEKNLSWHDFMVRMTGGVVAPLATVFDETWNRNMTFGTIQHHDGVILADAPGVPSAIGRAVIRLIDHAHDRVVVETPYLQGAFWRPLLRAAERGVPVTLITPLLHHKTFAVPSERQLQRAAERGIQVCRYAGRGGMTHARAVLVDDWGIFGSHALAGITSGRIAELSIATRNTSLVMQLERLLSADIAASQPQGTK